MMTRQEFEKIVFEAVAELPSAIQAKMDNVAIVIEDMATTGQRKKGGVRQGDILLGLYEGIPRTKRGLGYTMVLPDKITIFQKAIESLAPGRDEMLRQIKSTVRHEIAHHFGFDEEGAKRLDRKKRNYK